MKKANKKLTLTAILAASAISFNGCGSLGNKTDETKTIRETNTYESQRESQSDTISKESRKKVEPVEKETTGVSQDSGGDDEELIDFDMEDNVNVCVYGPPPEDD